MSADDGRTGGPVRPAEGPGVAPPSDGRPADAFAADAFAADAFAADAFADVDLPWGMSIRVRRDEFIGRWIRSLGAFDVPVTEAIVRLLDAGELAVDVGANIGQMTAAMARRVGPAGTVVAFEPCAAVYAELLHNVRRWAADPAAGRIVPHRLAVSARAGEARLCVPDDLAQNSGTAHLMSDTPDGSAQAGPEHETQPAHVEAVRAVRLDEVFPDPARVAVLKLDVEGHEREALAGAERLLHAGQVRDVVFEEYAPYPADTHRLLEGWGYALFRLSGTWDDPLLLDAAEAEAEAAYRMPNYLATRDPPRVRARYRARGWRTYRFAPAGGAPAPDA